jgi:hypothetical protein
MLRSAKRHQKFENATIGSIPSEIGVFIQATDISVFIES